MRIISQGGHADLPYERTHLCSNTENVMARCDGKEYLMGSYATAYAFSDKCSCDNWAKAIEIVKRGGRNEE